MTISIEKENILIYFGKMLPNVNVEEVLIHNYEMNRNKGLNYVELLGNNFLLNMFNSIELNINSFFTNSVLTSKTYKILDMLDMMLLNKLDDFNFKNIVFKNEDNDKYYFEVVYD